MRVATLRRADRWLGVPGCLALTALRRLATLRRRNATPRILFIKLLEQGTTVLARPALTAAAARVGPENVYCLVLEENREILDLLGLIPRANVIGIPGQSLPGALRGALRSLAAIRRIGFDAVVDLEFFARATAILACLSGAPRRAGLHPGPAAGPWRGSLFTHPVLYQPDLHTAQLFETLFLALERDGDTLPTLPFTAPTLPRWEEVWFHPTTEDRASVADLLQGFPPGGRLILLNANAGDLEPLRRWPSERYVALARRLLDAHPEALILFTGSPGEQETSRILAERVGSPRCASVAGRTTLRQLFTLLAVCDLLVTNDSGPGHFATLTAAPALVLFGPESPHRFGPLSPRVRPLYAGIACSPCLSAQNNRRSSCRDNACMQALSVAQVSGAAEELLRGRPALGSKA